MNLRSEVWIRVEYLVGREELSFRLIGSREGGKELRCKIVGGGEREICSIREMGMPRSGSGLSGSGIWTMLVS